MTEKKAGSRTHERLPGSDGDRHSGDVGARQAVDIAGRGLRIMLDGVTAVLDHLHRLGGLGSAPGLLRDALSEELA